MAKLTATLKPIRRRVAPAKTAPSRPAAQAAKTDDRARTPPPGFSSKAPSRPAAQAAKTDDRARTPPPGFSSKAPSRPAAAKPQFDLSTPAGQGHALAETVVMALIDRLRHEAEMRNGRLTLANIERLADDFHNKSAALRQAFELTFEAYARARERAKFAQNRNYPFDRVLVRRFEHLLACGGGGIPRRVLPGFFMAVEMMLGPQVLEAYQEHCRIIVERIRNAQGGKFAWPDLYADPEAAGLAVDALVAMASYFADYDKRARWFLTVVNGHLGPAPANASPEEAAWQLDEETFRGFLAAFFAEIKDSVATAVARTDFAERFGVEKCRAVADAMARIYGR
ncbi:MAG: hypothetical protein IT564_04640 [Rhodospirillales bacterium]|nr:hypothetical protein [Rhodospirillales bacterium]